METDKKEQAIQLLRSQKLLPLYYHHDAGVSIALMQALYEGGIRMIEYTARGSHALSNFKAMKEAAEKVPNMQLGVGTIKTAGQAKEFMDAGADFVVCPTFNEAVAEVTHQAGLLWIPGCMTPTEIAAAEMADATLVKIFPGHLLGPSYISAIKELFPALQFMPTGGVEAEPANLRSWFGAGVVAVGMGSKLFTADIMQRNDYAKLKQSVAEALELVKQAATLS
jgi:2-dehydro-3-deoxyphosphogluconate aldolase/(4S)-4-hydroxy-2-oxoglutarate aldolase